jgi:hypothetical protein
LLLIGAGGAAVRLALFAALVCLAPSSALAEPGTSREALARLEESLAMRLEDGGFSARELSPAIVVSIRPAYEESKAWYPTAALATLGRVFGQASLRSCEACMAPRLYLDGARLEQVTADLVVVEITRLDAAGRGSAAPARTAVWLDETNEGVSLRVVDLANSHIVVAENFDPALKEAARTRKITSLARELDRRARGDSITQTFFDFAMYPGQHVSIDWTEQWGDTNANLSGVSLSAFDPVLGIGGAYYRVMPSAKNILVGAKIVLSLPTALVTSVTNQSTTVIDPLLTGVFVVRYPIGSSNYGVILTASTNGRVGIGVSLMNTTLLPFLP